MMKWEEALSEFLKKYENEDYYEGAIACGSYVSGNNNEFSDIDVHIILKREVEWRERGNLEVNGFLIEYFANPVNKYEKYMEEELSELGNHTTMMFANGVIVSDKHGEVKKLKDRAMTCSKNKVNEFSEFDILSSKYSCWDKFDELKVIYHEKRDNFYLAYYELYKALLNLFHKVKRIREISLTKIDKLIDNRTFRDNYGLIEFYDDKDAKIIRDCLNIDSKENMIKKIETFYNYVMEISGGFDINKFVLRSEVK